MPTHVTVPILETERLILRGHGVDDFTPCSAMWADPRVPRHLRDKPFTAEETWSRLLRYVGHWAVLGFGYWVVAEKETGGFVGEVGFADYKREIEPPLEGTPEIGWVFACQAHGKGYATEVRAATAWGDAHFGTARTACISTRTIFLPSVLPSNVDTTNGSGLRTWDIPRSYLLVNQAPNDGCASAPEVKFFLAAPGIRARGS